MLGLINLGSYSIGGQYNILPLLNLQLKIGDKWLKYDSIYVKVDNKWIECNDVYVKINNQWCKIYD